MRFKSISALIFLTAIALPLSSFAKVYQCTNSKGEVNFSNIPCPENEKKEEVKIEGKRSGAQSNAHMDIENASELCISAIENAHYTVDQGFINVEKNYKGKYIDKDEYNLAISYLNILKKRITLSHCESSSGEDRKFYECMEDGYTLISTCGDRHNPTFLE